jgi:hypothetical protein
MYSIAYSNFPVNTGTQKIGVVKHKKTYILGHKIMIFNRHHIQTKIKLAFPRGALWSFRALKNT